MLRFYINNRRVYPIFDDNLSKTIQLESDQRFFRETLSGKIKLCDTDYDYIDAEAFETQFNVLLRRSVDGGLTWADYWTGKFHKTDCKFDVTSRILEVTPLAVDGYTDILAGWEKEYDLIKLAIATEKVRFDKRPLIQVYVPGESVVGCFLAGNAWEQDVTDPETSDSVLRNTYKFYKTKTFQRAVLSNATSVPVVEGVYTAEGAWVSDEDMVLQSSGNLVELRYTFITVGPAVGYNIDLVRTSDSQVLYRYQLLVAGTPQSPLDREITLDAYPGSGMTGTVDLFWTENDIYARELVNLDKIGSTNTFDIPTDDLVANNRNYTRVIGFDVEGFISLTSLTSIPATEYGKADNGRYFVPPGTTFEPDGTPIFPNERYYPIGRSTWGLASLWFRGSYYSQSWEEPRRTQYTLKDASEISEVIKVLLGEVAPDIQHEATSDYSQFLYSGFNPVQGAAYGGDFKLLLTQKSNILNGEYDQPAQKAPITLKQVLDMLAQVFQCYWYVEDNKLKAEHISWFKNGGSYGSSPQYNADLTTLKQPQNSKAWGFGLNQYEYDKNELPERFEFSWMDDVTDGFQGFPIEVVSTFVEEGNIEDTSVASFTPDIDLMLAAPEEFSQDGFALMAAFSDEEGYYLPYVTLYAYEDALALQNGILSWLYLHPAFWIYNLPSREVIMNDTEGVCIYGVVRGKKQKVNFPSKQDLDPMKLIKTSIGDGEIQKISVNLQSRMNDIELKYDTE